MTKDRKLGVLYATFSATTWGTVFVLSKWLAAPVVTLAFWRFTVCSLCLLAMVTATGRLRPAWAAFRAQPVRFLFMGLLGGYAMYLLVLLSLEYTTTNTTQIIMNCNAIFIAPLAVLIGERVSWRNWMGLAIGITGCVLVVTGSSSVESTKDYNHILGGVLAVGSGLSWACYTVVGREPIRKYGGLECTAVSMSIGMLLLAATLVCTRSPIQVKPVQVLPILYLGLVPTALGFAAWFKAMETLPASVVGPFQFLQPAIGVTLAVCLLKETLNASIVLGAVLAFTGVYCTTASSDDPE